VRRSDDTSAVEAFKLLDSQEETGSVSVSDAPHPTYRELVHFFWMRDSRCIRMGLERPLRVISSNDAPRRGLPRRRARVCSRGRQNGGVLRSRRPIVRLDRLFGLGYSHLATKRRGSVHNVAGEREASWTHGSVDNKTEGAPVVCLRARQVYEYCVKGNFERAEDPGIWICPHRRLE
jgi:hypothetical protein